MLHLFFLVEMHNLTPLCSCCNMFGSRHDRVAKSDERAGHIWTLVEASMGVFSSSNQLQRFNMTASSRSSIDEKD